MKTSGFQRGLVEAPPTPPPRMPGDAWRHFHVTAGWGVEDGGGFSTPLRTEQPPQQRTAGPSVRGPKAERPCYELGSLKRGPLRFLNRRNPARDKTNSAA